MTAASYYRHAAKRTRQPRQKYTASTKYPTYTPPSLQAVEFHQSKADIRALFGGDRAGKSHPGGYETIKMVRQNPGCLFWTGALTQEKITNLWKIHKKFLSKSELAHIQKTIVWYNQKKEQPAFWTHPNGAQHAYKSFKAGAGLWASDEVKGIHLDEDPERVTTDGEQIYNDCLSRIVSCNGRIWVTATPVLGKNWMYSRIFLYNAENRQNHDPDKDIERWTVSLLDNIFITKSQKEKAKGRMTLDEIDRRFYGLFTTLSGAIFKEFDERRHIKDFGKLPASMRKAVSIDLGAGHPFCALFGGYFDGKLYVWDEYYEDEKGSVTSKEHADCILEYEKDRSYFRDTKDYRNYEARLCDHDLQERIDLESFGVWSQPADKRTQLSWLILNRLFKEDNIVIHPRCFQLKRTIPLYRYKPGINEKEMQIKDDDDAVDALRYLAMYFFAKSAFNLDDIMSSSADDFL